MTTDDDLRALVERLRATPVWNSVYRFACWAADAIESLLAERTRDTARICDLVDDVPILLWWNGRDWIFPDGSRLSYPRQFIGLAFNPENVLSTNGWMVLGCAMTQGTGGGQRREAA